jgi:hypothetical protein
MGYWRSALMEMQDAGVDLRGTFDKYVCTECFADDSTYSLDVAKRGG